MIDLTDNVTVQYLDYMVYDLNLSDELLQVIKDVRGLALSWQNTIPHLLGNSRSLSAIVFYVEIRRNVWYFSSLVEIWIYNFICIEDQMYTIYQMRLNRVLRAHASLLHFECGSRRSRRNYIMMCLFSIHENWNAALIDI